MVNDFSQKNDLYAGALLLGLYINLNQKKTVFLDINFGLGARQRKIVRKSSIPGYDTYVFPMRAPDGPKIDFENDEQGTVHVPATIRILFLLK